jgi:putative transferase (TIGR04331 family)
MQNLVTTGLIDTFSSEDENLIIGKWCLRELYKSKKKYLISELPYHWAEKNKVKKDYEYLKDYYYRTISNFTASLNYYHQIDKSERYWHIILGAFFANFIPLVWDRWENIKYLAEDKFKTIALICEDDFPVFEDFKDFFMNFNDDYWNHLIYVEIIKVLKDKNFTYQTKKFSYYKKKNYQENGQFLSKIGNFINPLFKNNNFLFYDVAFQNMII